MNRTVPVKKNRNVKRRNIVIILLVILAFSIVTRLKSYSSYYDAESFSIEIPTGYGQVLESKMNNQEIVGYAESSSSNSIVVLSSRYNNKQSYKAYKQILDGALQKHITSPVYQDFNNLPIKDAYEDRLAGRKIIVIDHEGLDGMKQTSYVFATNKYVVSLSPFITRASMIVLKNVCLIVILIIHYPHWLLVSIMQKQIFLILKKL